MHAMQFLAAVEVGQYVSPWKIILLIIFLLDHLIVEYGFGLGR